MNSKINQNCLIWGDATWGDATMKKIATFILLSILVIFSGCKKSITEPGNTTGMIVVYSEPAGAKIYLDREDTEKVTPAPLRNLEEGIYTVKVTLEGYTDWDSDSIEVIAGEKTNINVILDKKYVTGLVPMPKNEYQISSY